MTKIHIPPAALEAGARAAMDDAGWRWDTADETRRDIWRKTARAAFVAMVEAWPGIETEGVELHFSTARTAPVTTVKAYRLILPLMEKQDDKA